MSGPDPSCTAGIAREPAAPRVGAFAPWSRRLARLAAGRCAVYMMTAMRAVDTTKARRELGWTPSIPSWRDGFRSFRARRPEA